MLQSNFNTANPRKSLIEALETTLHSDKTSDFSRVTNFSHLFETTNQLADVIMSRYKQFVVIGVGGSSAGPRTIAEYTKNESILFIDNVDSVELEYVLGKIDPKISETAFIFISKSGTTVEVLWNYAALDNHFQSLNHSIVEHAFFITEPVNNPLTALAKKHNRLTLEIPISVGGRYSVLTPVGLLIARFCGLNIDEIKQGAQLALSDKNKVVNICEQFIQSFEKKENITLFWFYNSNFRWFGSWLQQLWAESLGKQTQRNGKPAPPFSTPMIAIGSCDQHSILQQVAHGPKDKFVCLFSFKSVEQSTHVANHIIFDDIKFMQGRNYGDLIACQSKATYEALKQNGISCEFFDIDDSQKSKALGYLFMFFQLVVATLGEHGNINAFDQPGVTLGKDITSKMLKSH